ncbi:MAG TPA: hypothetical protein DCG54_09740 [Anaerolineae bacterium]|nr:hypothetical protein [Anaerolineae bacterium]
MDIFERTKTALATLSPIPVAMDRMLFTSAPPDTYIICDLIVSNPSLHLDDAEKGRQDRVQVTIFNRTGLENLPNVDGAMLAAGFTKSAMRQIDVGAQSSHYAMALDYYFYKETIA